MTKKDNINIAYKLGAKEIEMDFNTSKNYYSNGWRVFSKSYDKYGNASSVIIEKDKEYILILKCYSICF